MCTVYSKFRTHIEKSVHLATLPTSLNKDPTSLDKVLTNFDNVLTSLYEVSTSFDELFEFATIKQDFNCEAKLCKKEELKRKILKVVS